MSFYGKKNISISLSNNEENLRLVYLTHIYFSGLSISICVYINLYSFSASISVQSVCLSKRLSKAKSKTKIYINVYELQELY